MKWYYSNTAVGIMNMCIFGFSTLILLGISLFLFPFTAHFLIFESIYYTSIPILGVVTFLLIFYKKTPIEIQWVFTIVGIIAFFSVINGWFL